MVDHETYTIDAPGDHSALGRILAETGFRAAELSHSMDGANYLYLTNNLAAKLTVETIEPETIPVVPKEKEEDNPPKKPIFINITGPYRARRSSQKTTLTIKRFAEGIQNIPSEETILEKIMQYFESLDYKIEYT